MATFVASCSFWGNADEECQSIEEYQQADVANEIAIPSGLDKPESSKVLAVPDEPVPAEALSENAACLQRPPNYFDKPLPASGN